MSTLYLIASSYNRFHSELGLLGSAAAISTCSTCGYSNSAPKNSFAYFWDAGFGMPSRSVEAGHDVFWCEFAMLAVSACVTRVRSPGLPFVATPAICMASDEAATQLDIPVATFDFPLEWLKPLHGVDVMDPQFPTCSKCGKFAAVAQQLTRLHLRRADLPDHGIFQVNQNRGCATFVTEDGKKAMLRTGLKGIGFYPAGKVIE